MDKISVVVPCYNEENAIELFYSELIIQTSKINDVIFEYIFVNDGSTDETLNIMKKLRAENKDIKIINFSKNFGQESAIFAGLENSTGEYVTVINADLQDPPSLISKMYATLKSTDCTCVAARRVSRKGEPKIRSFFARLFFMILKKISNIDICDGVREYRLMKRKQVDAILRLNEYNRFSKGIFSWVGFKTIWIEYECVARVAGETKWSFIKLFLYSVEALIGFSDKIFVLPCIFAVSLFIASICYLIYIFASGITNITMMIFLILFLGSVIIFMQTLNGSYLHRIYKETKKRPIYIQDEV